MNPTGVDLDLMDDRDYSDTMVKGAFRNGAIWELMLDPDRIDRTLELIHNTKSSLELQLGHAKRTQNGGEPMWRKRTLTLLRIVNTFLTEARTEAKRLDQEEREESVEVEMTAWKALAGQLVDLMPNHPVLRGLPLPYGHMTVAEWAALRAEKNEGKLAA